MKKRQLLLAALCVLLAVCLLVGCGASEKDVGEMYDENIGVAYANASDDLSLSENQNGTLQTNRKIISNIYMSIETKEFDELLSKIDAQITALGGYVESSDSSGIAEEGARHVTMSVRIPSGANNEFTTYISENSTVTGKSVNTEDVTSSYVDTESRLSALRTERKALEALLSEAQSMEDILTIRSQLTDVICDIESYQAQLNVYDDLVAYATVELSIREVDREQVIAKQTVWQEIGERFPENLQNVGEFFKGLFVFLVSFVPYLAILSIPALIVLWIVLGTKKRRAKKKSVKEQKEQTEP